MALDLSPSNKSDCSFICNLVFIIGIKMIFIFCVFLVDKVFGVTTSFGKPEFFIPEKQTKDNDIPYLQYKDNTCGGIVTFNPSKQIKKHGSFIQEFLTPKKDIFIT